MSNQSIPARRYAALLAGPALGTAIWIIVLLTTHYGDDKPLFLNIGGPLFVGGVTAWFLLVKLKKVRPHQDGP